MGFAEWRISAWEGLVANSGASIPVGPFALAPSSSLLNSNAPDPRYVSHIIDGYQVFDEAQGLRGDGNLALALKLGPVQGSHACLSQPETMSQCH